MIVCKKCGEKYEDDMPRCLWCDALNPEHPLNKVKMSAPASPDVAEQPADEPVTEQPTTEPTAPSAAEVAPEPAPASPDVAEPAAPSAAEAAPNISVIEIEQDQDDAIAQQFRQKGFLWSVVLAGVFVSWLCHHKYLKKTDKFNTKFFLPLFGIQCVARYLFYMVSKIDLSAIGMSGHLLHVLITLIVCLFYWIIIGKLGIALLKKAIPNYDPVAFKKRERIGIAIGIPISILEFTAGFLQYGTTARMLGAWLGHALQ
jgi:hypothetical protein